MFPSLMYFTSNGFFRGGKRRGAACSRQAGVGAGDESGRGVLVIEGERDGSLETGSVFWAIGAGRVGEKFRGSAVGVLVSLPQAERA
jgi:hypothetical protein